MEGVPGHATWLRPLSVTEHELAEHLIRGALPSAGELIAQLDHAQARGEPPFVEFEVAAVAPRSKAVSRGVVEGRSTDPDNRSWSHVLLWIEHGYISALELAWVSDEPPEEFPHPDEIEVLSPTAADPRRAAAEASKRWVVSWPLLITGTIGALLGLAATLALFDSVAVLDELDRGSSNRVAGRLAFLGAVVGAFAATRLIRHFRR